MSITHSCSIFQTKHTCLFVKNCDMDANVSANSINIITYYNTPYAYVQVVDSGISIAWIYA